ncbi:MAG: hypothetical protein K2I21_09410, partial [Acetatifactor sp.]|nr:hypothetical protein [Acetatifactor sp.]
YVRQSDGREVLAVSLPVDVAQTEKICALWRKMRLLNLRTMVKNGVAKPAYYGKSCFMKIH